MVGLELEGPGVEGGEEGFGEGELGHGAVGGVRGWVREAEDGVEG